LKAFSKNYEKSLSVNPQQYERDRHAQETARNVTNAAAENSGSRVFPRIRLTAELVEILNALSCVAYRET